MYCLANTDTLRITHTHTYKVSVISLQWRHNGRDSVSNHQPHHCLFNRIFRRRSKKASKLRVTGLCAANSLVTGEFSTQMASNADNVAIKWRHYDATLICLCMFAKSNCKIYTRIAGKIKCQNDHVISSKCVIYHCLVFNWMPNWMCQPKLFLMCWYTELLWPAWCHLYYIWWEVNHFSVKMYCMKKGNLYCSINRWNDKILILYWQTQNVMRHCSQAEHYCLVICGQNRATSRDRGLASCTWINL